MKSALSFALIVSLFWSAVTVRTEGLAGGGGPIARSAEREAARLAATSDASPQVTTNPWPGTTGRPLELKWSRLGPLATFQRVDIAVVTGGTVSGEVVRVREDGLVLNVRQTTVPNRPTGNG